MDRLRSLLTMPDNDVLVYLENKLLEDYIVITDKHNYIFGIPKGDQCVPVCLCAHVDTVRDKGSEPVVLCSKNGTLFNANGILGADDRAGISIALDVCDRLAVKPYLLFTNGEEIGGTGMKKFIEAGHFKEHLDNIYLTVSLDRQGHNDYVSYMDRTPNDLECLLISHGYTRGWGSFSDGKLLWMAYDVANINVSVGYNLKHTSDEFLLLESYYSAGNRVTRFIQDINKPYHVHERLVKMDGKYKLVSPSDYDGMGTAASEDVYGLSMVHYPPNVKLKETVDVVRSAAPRCFVCGRNDRPVSYDYTSTLHLCNVCKARMYKKYGRLTLPNAMHEADLLDKARAKSREANRLLNKTMPAIAYPSCPACKDNRDVQWSTFDGGFYCSSCGDKYQQDKKPGAYNGKFWVLNNRKVFTLDDSVYVFDESNTRLLGQYPLNKNPYLTECDCCHEYVANTIPYAVGRNGSKIKHVCRACSREVLQTLLKNFPEEPTPPWDE